MSTCRKSQAGVRIVEKKGRAQDWKKEEADLLSNFADLLSNFSYSKMSDFNSPNCRRNNSVPSD